METMGSERSAAASIPLPAEAAAQSSLLVAGRYRIDALLGRGGMGSVHRAWDTLRARAVALKRLELPEAGAAGEPRSSAPKTPSARETRRRAQLIALFQREYHTLAQLAHPRIIEVHDYGLYENRPYYTMELLEGHDLSRTSPWPWQRACSILRDVASALTLLHARHMLHRDVSPRNVLCSPQGHAKLLDFGAMAPMGVSGVLVGTPAFVAPEAVLRQALDARSDLYSLGALGYLLLTGRPPYRVHAFGELRDAYRTQPLPPSAYAPDVPKALDALLMQLIQIDRAARPGSAVELVERLCALAELEQDPGLAIANAYLSTPTLVGRQTEIVAVRRRALRARRGHGASLLVSAAAGVGRSRFLDACALEGKLAGALVLRSDPTASSTAEYGVMRSLLMQVHASLSDAEREATELPTEVHEQLVPGLVWTLPNSKPRSMQPPAVMDEDAVTLTHPLQQYFARLALLRPLMILVDDFHAIDGSSGASIASLAQVAAHHPLVIVATYELHAPQRAEAALRLLSQCSRPLPLGPLQAEQTEAMLRSVFGSVQNLSVIANRLHELSAGKPSLCMELARHLIDSGVVQYRAGGFVLPQRLGPEDLPESLEQILLRRFARLSPHARELGATLALCAGAPLSVAQCLAASSSADPAQRQRELAELVTAETAVIREDYVSLRQGAFGAALLAGLSDPQVKAAHARLAAVLSEDESLCLRAAEHFLRADQAAAALDLLLRAADTDVLLYEWFAGYDALVEHALAACDRLGRPPRDAFLLRRARVYHRMQYLERCDRSEFLQYAQQLERMSGLTHFHALDTDMTREQRMTRALALVEADYARTPEQERIYSPLDAVIELASFLPVLAGYGTSTFDSELLRTMPSLEPYLGLAPAIDFVVALCDALRELRAGRHEGYASAVEQQLQRMDQPDGAGLPERRRRFTRLSLLYALALTDGALGRARVFERVAELEAVPRMRSNAWRARQIAHLYRGEVHEADECRRQVELLLVQDNARQAHQGTTLETEFMCYARSDDLLGLRRALPELEHMAEQHPGWRPVLLLGRAELERLRGRLDAALAHYEQGLALALPGQHMMWPYLAAFHVQTLVDAGRAAEAKTLGLARLLLCDQHRISLLAGNLVAAVAAAESALGDHETAIARLDPLLERVQRESISGLFAGVFHELRARLALCVGDARGFADHFERCRTHYGSALDSPFTGRLARLASAARDVLVDQQALRAAPPQRAARVSVERVRRELAACADAEERAKRTLDLLMEVTETDAGHLYAVQNSRLTVCASSAEREPSASLTHALEAFLDAVGAGDADATVVVDFEAQVDAGPSQARAGATFLGSDGRVYRPFAITIERGAEPIVAAVVALARSVGSCEPPQEVLAALGEELFLRGDITGFTLLS
jgi:hypothetical protein